MSMQPVASGDGAPPWGAGSAPGPAPPPRLPRVRSHALFLCPEEEACPELIVPMQISLEEGSPDLLFDAGWHALQGASSRMEDRVLVADLSRHPHFAGARRAVLMAVLDGHAGSGAVQYLEAHLPRHLLAEVAAQLGGPPLAPPHHPHHAGGGEPAHAHGHGGAAAAQPAQPGAGEQAAHANGAAAAAQPAQPGVGEQAAHAGHTGHANGAAAAAQPTLAHAGAGAPPGEAGVPYGAGPPTGGAPEQRGPGPAGPAAAAAAAPARPAARGPPDPAAALRGALLRCEAELMEQDCPSGSTALVALMLGGGLWLANVGDCRAVVCDDGEARQLTIDHKAGCGGAAGASGAAMSERRRLQASGAQLSADGYLQVTAPDGSCSDIAVSRNLGCAPLKRATAAGAGSRGRAASASALHGPTGPGMGLRGAACSMSDMCAGRPDEGGGRHALSSAPASVARGMDQMGRMGGRDAASGASGASGGSGGSVPPPGVAGSAPRGHGTHSGQGNGIHHAVGASHGHHGHHPHSLHPHPQPQPQPQRAQEPFHRASEPSIPHTRAGMPYEPPAPPHRSDHNRQPAAAAAVPQRPPPPPPALFTGSPISSPALADRPPAGARHGLSPRPPRPPPNGHPHPQPHPAQGITLAFSSPGREAGGAAAHEAEPQHAQHTRGDVLHADSAAAGAAASPAAAVGPGTGHRRRASREQSCDAGLPPLPPSPAPRADGSPRPHAALAAGAGGGPLAGQRRSAGGAGGSGGLHQQPRDCVHSPVSLSFPDPGPSPRLAALEEASSSVEASGGRSGHSGRLEGAAGPGSPGGPLQARPRDADTAVGGGAAVSVWPPKPEEKEAGLGTNGRGPGAAWACEAGSRGALAPPPEGPRPLPAAAERPPSQPAQQAGPPEPGPGPSDGPQLGGLLQSGSFSRSTLQSAFADPEVHASAARACAAAEQAGQAGVGGGAGGAADATEATGAAAAAGAAGGGASLGLGPSAPVGNGAAVTRLEEQAEDEEEEGGGAGGPALIPDPDLFHYHISQDSEFLICACDGLWDVMRNGEACRSVRRWLADGRSAAAAAAALCEAALRLGSADNVSAVVLRFSGRPLAGAHTRSMLRRVASEVAL